MVVGIDAIDAHGCGGKELRLVAGSLAKLIVPSEGLTGLGLVATGKQAYCESGFRSTGSLDLASVHPVLSCEYHRKEACLLELTL